jgi:hypothetical protein
MNVYRYSEAQQNLDALLERSRAEGGLLIKRDDGQEFLVMPLPDRSRSPLDVEGIDLGLTSEEIVSLVREQRERSS